MRMVRASELRAFWYETQRDGAPARYGVTAFSLEHAAELLRAAGFSLESGARVLVIEDVTFDQLDAHHVVPNIGPMQIRGVWFPRRNL